MLRIALKNVKHNPKRLILTAIAVALGVSLVAATHVFTNALSSGFSALFNDIYDTVDVIVEPDPDAQIDLPEGVSVFQESDIDKVRATAGVAAADGNLTYPGVLLDKDGKAPNGGQGGPPTLVINWSTTPDLAGATVIDGRAPAADGEAIVDVGAFAKDALALGDTIKIASERGVAEFTVVGTARFGEDNNTQGATLVYTTAASAQLFAGVDGFDGIQALVTDGANPDQVAEAVGAVIPEGTRALTGEQKAAEQAAEFDQVLQYVDIFTLAFALISLFVGAYIIANTFRIIVTQRTRELGLLRAIGMRGSQVRSMILLEAAAVGVVASTTGLLLGWGLALGITAWLERLSGDIFGTITLPPDAIAWGYGLGMLVTLVSALLPALHAARIAPMEALRESGTQSRKPLRTRNIVGVALLAAGGAVFAIGLFAGFDSPYVFVGFGGALLVLGTTLLGPQVLVPLAFGLRGVLTKLFRLDGKLAANNIHREPRRSANTAAALMIGVMLLALVATFTQSLKATFSEQFSTANADFFITPTAGPVPQAALDVVAADADVAYVSRVAWEEVQVDGATRSLAIIDADTADLAFGYPHDRDFTELAGGVFVDPAIQAQGVGVGDSVTIVGPATTQTLTVTGLYERDGDANYFVDWETGSQLVGETAIQQAMVGLNDGADPEIARDRIESELAVDFPLVQLQDASELQQFVNQFIDLFLTIISALLGSALVIAILGVMNTLLLSVTERTREIGLLRAVGLRKSSVWRMITIESLVMALFGAMLGMILGVAVGAALVRSLADFGFSSVAIPWRLLGVYTLLAGVAGVAAALWPARRASRLDILKAIATE